MSSMIFPSNITTSLAVPTPLQPGFKQDIELFAYEVHKQMLEHSKHINDFRHLQLKADFTYLQTGARSFDTFPTLDKTHLWPGWLPKASLVLLEGPLNSAKSRFCADLAARFTAIQGTFPDGQAVTERNPEVLLITTRHHPHYHQSTFNDITLHKRLHHLNRLPIRQPIIHDITLPPDPFHSLYGFTFSEHDFTRLTDWLDMYRSPLVIIDDLMSTMGSHSKATERFISQTLLRLHALAVEYNTTFLMLRNTPAPGSPRSTLSHVQRSPLFAESAQVCLQISHDPDYPAETATYLLSCSRSEGHLSPASLRFRVVSDPINPKQGILQWDNAASPWTGQELYTYAQLAPPNALQREILAILTEQSPKALSAQEISTLLPDEKPDTVSRSIRRMEEKGRIRKHIRGNYELLHPPVKPISDPEQQTEIIKNVSETAPPAPQEPQPIFKSPFVTPLSMYVKKPAPPSNLVDTPKNVSEKRKRPKNKRQKPQLVRSR